MRILELEMKNFGKFSDQTIHFHPGVNIISGENEMGKTTIHSFIRGMLFGITAQRGRASGKDEYALREPWENPYYYAGVLRLESGGKVFRLERNFHKRDKRVLLVCETDGEELSVEYGDLEVLLEGMNEQAFMNTVFISQRGAATDAGLVREMKNYMVNLKEAGDAGIYVENALKQLEMKKKKLEAAARMEAAAREGAGARTLQKTEYVGQELKGLQGRLEEARLAEGELKTRLQEEKAGYQELAARLRNGKIQEAEKRQEFSRRQLAKEKKRRQEQQKKRKICLWICLSVCIAAVLGAVLIPGVPGKAAVSLAGLLSAAAAVWIWRRSGKRADYGQLPADTVPDLRDAALEQQVSACMDRIDKLEAQLQKAVWSQEHLTAEIREKRTILGNLEENLQELQTETDRERSLDKERQALLLACDTIREVSKGSYDDLAAQVEERASSIIREITDGRYTSIRLDENMEVRINTPDKLLRLDQVSRGTADQMYFALRMAAGEAFSKGAPMPVILDDAFAMYDDRRLFNTLRWLYKSGRQVILFTCQTREEEMLRKIRAGA